jgi:pimeloyl-ACP methyl ester carboxylesterase
MTNVLHDPRTQVNGLEYVLEGDGQVTVVFENGIATPLEEWDAVVPRVATRARVLRYNHQYASSRGPSPARSPSEILADLERLLNTLGLEPPYLFAGHSWGGVIARLFAHAHPSDVVGLVFADATHEALDARTLSVVPRMYSVMLLLARARFVRRALARQLCPPGSSPAYLARIHQRLSDPVRWPIGLRTARAESAAIAPALDLLRRDGRDLPLIPVRVLTSNEQSRSARQVRDGWQATVARSPLARYTNVPSSGHYMPIECPDVVTDAILSVLDEVDSAKHGR